LDFAHAEGLTERGFLRERGDPVETSNEEFEYNYRKRRAEIELDLRTAQDEANILHHRCVDAGHHLDDYRTSRPSIVTASTPPSIHVLSESNNPLHQMHGVHGALTVAPTTAERHPTQWIGTWLRAVERERPDQPIEIVPVETPTSERSVIIQPTPKPLMYRSLADYESESFDTEAFLGRPPDIRVEG
jgi:hypothetical protein